MFRKLLEHHITLIAAVVLCIIVAGGAAYFLLKPPERMLTSVPARIMDIEEQVTADGQIDSDKHVSLSFEKAGTITAVNANVGDTVNAGQVLVTQDAAQLRASLLAADADIASAQANLTSLIKGATSQTRAVYTQNISTAQLALGNAVKDAYLKVQDALLNKLSSFFTNGTSANPYITIPTENITTQQTLNNRRLDMTTRLATWNSDISISASGATAVTDTTNDLIAAKSFLDALSAAVNRLNFGNSGLTNDQISVYVAAVNGAASEVNTAATTFDNALQAYKTANDQLSVVIASSTPEAIQIAQANLAKAQANAAGIQSQIANTMIIAPWSGIVASVNPKVGENFPANTPAVDIISSGAYKIDVMIPENEVGTISVNDPADISFDAYGPGITATGTVSSIDLAPTVTNGVAAYKTTIRLSGSDPRIRTGMTGNVIIHGASASSVIAVPSSAIIKKNEGAYVLVLDSTGSYSERKVTTGLAGSGWTQVVSGLENGDPVAAFGENTQ